MSDDNGGPAFPIEGHPGMSLRDYFAAQALTGCLAAFAGENVGLPPPHRAAAQAYEYADAMLKAREAKR